MTRHGQDRTGGGVFAALQTIADRIASAATWAAAACLAALLLLVLGEIVVGLLSRVTRAVPSSIGFAWEYSAYLMGAAFMLGTGMTLRAGMHVHACARAWEEQGCSIVVWIPPLAIRDTACELATGEAGGRRPVADFFLRGHFGCAGLGPIGGAAAPIRAAGHRPPRLR